MRFQAATVGSHSMILVILVTSSVVRRRERELREQIARETVRINCLRRRVFPVRGVGGCWDARRLERTDDLFRVRGRVLPFFPAANIVSTREYLVTAANRARYHFISRYRVRATIP